MCGICGIYGFEDKALLQKMRDAINHRGPDAEGFYYDKLCSLGHKRLAIIDLSQAGKQPMCNADESIWVSFNGEIYNFAEIRKELEEKGYKFKSYTDTECILYAYEEYGTRCVKKFGGMFAFALWDSNKKLLLLARDRIGVKPLYYYWNEGKLLFASEIKAILQDDSIKREVDMQAFYHYLTFVTTPAPNTLFKGIKKLPPGCIAIVQNEKMKLEQYWNVADYNLDYSMTEEKARLGTSEKLIDSVRQRMISDVPQGVFLSGGLDSSTIVALMSELNDEPVNTFSIATGKTEKYNELKYAKIVADKFNTNHTELHMDEVDVVKFLPTLIHQEDEPIGDPVNIPIYYLSQEARKNGVIVLQVGEGSDELFCGYPFYSIEVKMSKLLQTLQKIPAPLRNIGRPFVKLAASMKYRPMPMIIDDYFERISKGQDIPWHTVLCFTEFEKNKTISEKAKQQSENTNSYSLIELATQIAGKNNADKFLQRERIFELKNRIAELLLMRVDKFTMAHAIEARVPFLDYKLVEFEMTVPPYSIQLKNGVTKYILKKAMQNKLPREIIYRKKIGFNVPVYENMGTDLRSIAENEFETREMKQFFNTERVLEIVKNKETKEIGNTSFRTWILLNFALWHKYWIKGEKI